MRIRDRLPVGLQVAFVGRREPPTGAQFYGQNVNLENVPVVEVPQGAPDPIRQSSYYQEGRAPTERWPGVNVAFHMNIPAIQAVMQDTFLTGKVRPLVQPGRGRMYGGQAPLTDRQNIDRGQADPYGNRVSVMPSGQVPMGAVNGYGIMYQPRGFGR